MEKGSKFGGEATEVAANVQLIYLHKHAKCALHKLIVINCAIGWECFSKWEKRDAMWCGCLCGRIASHRIDSVGWTLYLLTKPNCKSIGLNAFKVQAITTSGLNLYDSSEINEKFEAPLLSIGRIYSVSCFSH